MAEMIGSSLEVKTVTPGTGGWSELDLDRPDIERQWFEGRYEMIDGVLYDMPAAYFSNSASLANLLFILQSFLHPLGEGGGVAVEADLVLGHDRIVRMDATFLDRATRAKQRAAAMARGRSDPKRRRIYVPPTLIIEAVSPGHERHDRITKQSWYAAFGVPNYWLLNVFRPSLECFVRDGKAFHLDTTGGTEGEICPTAFPRLVIPLRQVWTED